MNKWICLVFLLNRTGLSNHPEDSGGPFSHAPLCWKQLQWCFTFQCLCGTTHHTDTFLLLEDPSEPPPTNTQTKNGLQSWCVFSKNFFRDLICIYLSSVCLEKLMYILINMHPSVCHFEFVKECLCVPLCWISSHLEQQRSELVCVCVINPLCHPTLDLALSITGYSLQDTSSFSLVDIPLASSPVLSLTCVTVHLDFSWMINALAATP